jgi:hypothetical protein
MGFSHLFGSPLTGAPVKDKSFSDEPVEGSAGFFHGSFDIGSVAEAYIDVILFESLETGFEAFDDVFSRESSSGGDLFWSAPENFSTQHVLMPGNVEKSDGLSDLFFSLTITIDFSGIKEIDAIVPCGFDAVDGVLFGLLGVGVEPVAE